MRTFYYTMYDDGNCPINPMPLEVEAEGMGHALQKIAACLSDHTDRVDVWMARPKREPIVTPMFGRIKRRKNKSQKRVDALETARRLQHLPLSKMREWGDQ